MPVHLTMVVSAIASTPHYHQMAVLKKRTNGSVRYCQYTSRATPLSFNNRDEAISVIREVH
ncbi:Transposase [Shigella dysenteriae 1617]|uniref:Transposase n=1 Tax=Shigella dysenteriae 1617 TaxID=754093 RepID=A0A0A6ZU44_SHIDY|nr:Transposase [Shigella dysenteriae 1617]